MILFSGRKAAAAASTAAAQSVASSVASVLRLLPVLSLAAGLTFSAVGPLGAQETGAQQGAGTTEAPSSTDNSTTTPSVSVAPNGTVTIDSSGAISGRPVPTAPADVAADAAATAGEVTPDAAAAQIDYAAWDKAAKRAETALADATTSDATLDQLRAEMVGWRASLLSAQSANASRIDTIRTQIAALGAAPADGATEPDEIATRRKDLNEQLATLQAPGITAEEAYTRADGLIREIDTVMRERQADALLKLSPSPLNPANWAAGLIALNDTAQSLWGEVTLRWKRPSARSSLTGNLPLIGLSLAFAVMLVWRGRPFMERLATKVKSGASRRGRNLWALLLSLGQIVIPTAGIFALSTALRLTAMIGPQGQAIAAALPALGFMVFTAIWLGGQTFRKGDGNDGLLHLTEERRTEGRLLTTSAGLVLGLEGLRSVAMDPSSVDPAGLAVVSFPVICVTSMLLWRLGQLLRQHLQNEEAGDASVGFRNRVMGWMGTAAVGIGIVAPLLAAVGYITAGSALVYPAVISLALMALIVILQRAVGEVYVLVVGGEEGAQDALIPVLIGFALFLISLPLFALIWGARVADLTEMWTRFREGFQMGETRISPTDFLAFAIIFGLGYTVTRFVQGALRTSVLPRTRLDQGGQNAVISGVGYLGIILAALIAVNATGLDLSGLALVASALTVGIGFGLQNIVSNFVSGIILLIERPVSEGDWIEVGTTSGTVKSISVRSTRIQTFDRSDVIVPNLDLVQQRVTNWTRFNLTGRVVLQINVGIGADTALVEKILREAAEAQPLALLNPPPAVVLVGFGNNLLNYELRVLLRDVNASARVRTDLNREIVRRFIEERIVVPPGTPEMVVHQGRPWVPPEPPAPGAESVPPEEAEGTTKGASQ